VFLCSFFSGETFFFVIAVVAGGELVLWVFCFVVVVFLGFVHLVLVIC